MSINNPSPISTVKTPIFHVPPRCWGICQGCGRGRVAVDRRVLMRRKAGLNRDASSQDDRDVR